MRAEAYPNGESRSRGYSRSKVVGSVRVCDHLTCCHRLNLSLLTVSKSVHHEAIDACFAANTIRFRDFCEFAVTTRKSKAPRRLIRKIELDEKGYNVDWLASTKLSIALDEFPYSPRTQEITVCYDSATMARVHRMLRQIVMQPAYKDMGRDHTLRCIGIGQFELVRPTGPNVHLKHCRLVEVWSAIQASELEQDLTAFNAGEEKVMERLQESHGVAGPLDAVQQDIAKKVRLWLVKSESARRAKARVGEPFSWPSAAWVSRSKVTRKRPIQGPEPRCARRGAAGMGDRPAMPDMCVKGAFGIYRLALRHICVQAEGLRTLPVWYMAETLVQNPSVALTGRNLLSSMWQWCTICSDNLKGSSV